MDTPDLKHVVQRVRDSRAWDFSTIEGFWEYGNTVVFALYLADPNFGELVKSEAQNHRVDALGRNVAVDAALYKPSGQAFDFMGSAGVGGANEVWWGTSDPVGHYGPEKWLLPAAVDGSTPIPEEPPVPGEPPVSDFSARFEALEQRIKAQEDMHAEVNKQLGSINKSIKELSERPSAPAPSSGVADHKHDVRFGWVGTVVTGPPRK